MRLRTLSCRYGTFCPPYSAGAQKSFSVVCEWQMWSWSLQILVQRIGHGVLGFCSMMLVGSTASRKAKLDCGALADTTAFTRREPISMKIHEAHILSHFRTAVKHKALIEIQFGWAINNRIYCDCCSVGIVWVHIHCGQVVIYLSVDNNSKRHSCHWLSRNIKSNVNSRFVEQGPEIERNKWFSWVCDSL